MKHDPRKVVKPKVKLLRVIRRLRIRAGMDYGQIENALRIGLLALRHGATEKGLEKQHDLATKRIIKEKKGARENHG